MKRPKGKYAWTATVGEKGQIVIPKQARDVFDIKSGDMPCDAPVHDTEAIALHSQSDLANEVSFSVPTKDRIKIRVGNVCRIECIEGNYARASVKIVGDEVFLKYFGIELDGEYLLISIKNPTGSADNRQSYDGCGYEGENYVQIFMNCDCSLEVENYLDLCAKAYTNRRGHYEVSVTADR